jgi:hypothetical protein
MEIAEDRPPYVTFEVRGVEDRDASIAAGMYKTKDVDFALITPQGSKDRIERIVSEWFENLQLQVQQNRFKGDWLRQYRGAYDAWKEGRELPLNGTPILTWPVLSPTQSKTCIDANIRTVEDLALANEETIGRLGMGGRDLKSKAVSWMTAAAGPGKITEEMAALRANLSDANDRNATLEKQVKDLAAQVAKLAK